MASWVQLIFEDVNVDCNECLKSGTWRPSETPCWSRADFPNRQITKHVAWVFYRENKKVCSWDETYSQDGIMPVWSGLFSEKEPSTHFWVRSEKNKVVCIQHLQGFTLKWLILLFVVLIFNCLMVGKHWSLGELWTSAVDDNFFFFINRSVKFEKSIVKHKKVH